MMRIWSTKWLRGFGTLRRTIRLRTSKGLTRSIRRCWCSFWLLAHPQFPVLGPFDCSLLADRLGWRDHENSNIPGCPGPGCDLFGGSEWIRLSGAGWLRGCERSHDLLHDDGAGGAAFDFAWRTGVFARLFPALSAAAGASSQSHSY